MLDDLLGLSKKYGDEILEANLEKKYGKIYRVQGETEPPNVSKFRFSVLNKKVKIIGDDMLHVTFDDELRVAQFWMKRGNKAEVFKADVDVNFINKIRKEAVPQNRAKEFPNRPQIDDPTKTDNSFGIPKIYFEELLESLKNPEIIKYNKK